MLREEEVAVEQQEAGPALGTAEAPEFEATPEVWNSMVGSLPEEMRAAPVLQETKDFESFVNQHLNQQKLIGKNTIAEPQEDWTDDQWGDLYGKLGRPEDSSGYFGDEEGIKALNTEIKEKFGESTPDLNPEELGQWAETFHKAGTNPKQARELLDKYVEVKTAEITAANEQANEIIAENIGALRQKWGDSYNANKDMANQAFDKLAPDALKALVSENSVLANNEGFLSLFHTLGLEIAGGTQTQGGRSTPGFTPNSPAAAEAELATIEANHGTLINTDPNGLNMAERAKRQSILDRQMELYKLKYPEES